MGKHPLMALDLPLKAIAFQDSNNLVWLAYNDTAYLEDRYLLPPATFSALFMEEVIRKILGPTAP